MSIAGESSFVGSWYPFDSAEKQLLRRSWRTLETNTEEVSCGIYTMIFNQCPEARKLFPFMRLPANESDKKSKEFVFQALRFIQVLESAILNLDNLDAFNPILDNLGRRHGKLESSVGFRSHYWSVFMECTIFHIRLALANSKTDSWGEAELDGVVTLWRHLVDGICDRIKAGYLVDLANRSNSKSARSSIALSAKSSPYYVDIPASHEMITERKQPIAPRSESADMNVQNDLEVDNYSTGCFSRICRPLCRNKVGKRVVTKCYY